MILRVGSYNLRSAIFNEALCGGDELQNWPYRKAEVIHLIQRQNLDVLGVQEDTIEQFHDLAVALQQEYTMVNLPEGIDTQNPELNTLFVHKQYPVLEQGRLWISYTPDKKSTLPESLCIRHFNYALVLIDGKKYLLINVHLDHSEEYTFKTIEAKTFITILQTHLAGYWKKRTILIGDFNLLPDDNEAYQTIAKDFVDISRLLNVREPTHPTWGRYPVCKQIDYIFVSPDLQPNICSFTIIKDTYQRPDGKKIEPSDHFLIRAEVCL